jgi:hypothetical protein
VEKGREDDRGEEKGKCLSKTGRDEVDQMDGLSNSCTMERVNARGLT